jgi:hypothetical protein
MRTILKQFVSTILIVSTLSVQIFFPLSTLLIAPKNAHALAVVDAGNIAQNTITAANSSIQTGLMTSLQIKELTFDAIAYGIAKQILRGITSSVVNWINNGFEGSPAFLSDPGQFFTDIGDEILGGMILGSDLAFLCSNFSIDIRLQLAFKYRPFQKGKAACTLTDIINNTTNAAQGASINGFTAGDFRQGRMPAFVSMTTEPQNNFIGAYVIADTEATARIANASARANQELSQGKGFLSFKTCKDERVITESEANKLTARNSELANSGQSNSQEFLDNNSQLQGYYESASNETTRKKCETQTPGSVIAGTLETSLGSPVRELELADEFNEIINALFAQLVQKVLVGGLKGVSGTGASDTEGIAQQLQQEQAFNYEQLQASRSNILDTIDTFITDAWKYRDAKNESLKYVSGLRIKFVDVKTCYNTALQGSSRRLTQNAISRGLDKIKDMDAIIEGQLVPKITTLTLDVRSIERNISDLSRIKATAEEANQVGDIQKAATEYNNLIPSISLYKVKANEATDEYNSYTDSNNGTMRDLERRARDEANACKYFP